MTILLLLIPLSMGLMLLAVAAFVWAVKRGQFDDLDTPALDILEDNDRPLPPPQSPSTDPGPANPVDPADAPREAGP